MILTIKLQPGLVVSKVCKSEAEIKTLKGKATGKITKYDPETGEAKVSFRNLKASDLNMTPEIKVSSRPDSIVLRPCPYCKSKELKDCYVYIKCEKCGMTGPQMNGGNNDAHADHMDHKAAISAWNDLPRIK